MSEEVKASHQAYDANPFLLPLFLLRAKLGSSKLKRSHSRMHVDCLR
jgi:hypothetical protein